MKLAEMLRDALPQRSIVYHCGSAGLKSQLKRADRSGAQLALILGDDELNADTVTVKYLREKREQCSMARDSLAKFLEDEFENRSGSK
jgi:histidyl-tRNA synthetase